MKIESERPNDSNVIHELVSNGGPKVDGEREKETKHSLLADKMVEQTYPSEHSFKVENLNGGKTGQVRVEDVSYDKDVVEIKLPDTVVSSDYDGHFVKDVCIDEGVLADQKASAEKIVVQKVSPDFDSSTGDANVDPTEEIQMDFVKSAPVLKSQVVILPVTCASDGNTEEQISSCKVHDLEGNNTTSDFTNPNDEKLNPQGANHCQQVCTVIPETCENPEPSLDGDAIDQVSSKDCHETGASIASENINFSGLSVESTPDGVSAAMLGDDVATAALDKGESNHVNHYNPFIAYGSLEDTWEPKYTLPTNVNAASVVPICPVEKTDSFSDLVNRTLGGFDSVEKIDSFRDLVSGAPGGSDSILTDEIRIKHSRLDSIEESSSGMDFQLSEESNDQRQNLVDEIGNDAEHGTGRGTSLSTSSADPSDVKSENHPKCENDDVQDVNDFNPRDAEDGTKRSEDTTDNRSSTLSQSESEVQQNGFDSAKLMARSDIRNPFEASFSGPSITSDPLTPSGRAHCAGNISLRSDSSTTSTRSFAFPVLQTEWNSSPVKMAKADRRRLRDRGWSYKILCCKF